MRIHSSTPLSPERPLGGQADTSRLNKHLTAVKKNINILLTASPKIHVNDYTYIVCVLGGIGCDRVLAGFFLLWLDMATPADNSNPIPGPVLMLGILCQHGPFYGLVSGGFRCVHCPAMP